MCASSILIKALHGGTGRGLIVQVPNSSIGRLQLDNFWIVNLGIGNHSYEKRTFILQSFAVLGLQTLNHVLAFFLQVFLVKNFGSCPLVTLKVFADDQAKKGWKYLYQK